MANIILDYTTEAQLRAALVSAPKDLLERGDSLELVQTKAEIFFDAPVSLTGFTTGPESGILLSCSLNASYVENPDVLSLPFAYSATAGAAWRIHGANRPYLMNVDIPYLTIKGMQFMQAAGDTQKAIFVTANGAHFTVLHSIIESSGQLAYCYPLEVNGSDVKVISSLITHRSNREAAIYMNSANALFENVTIVRTGNFTKGSSAFNLVRSNATIKNCIATGFDYLTNTASASGDNNACSGLISFGNNKLENIVAADTFIDLVSDFRTKASSPVVDSGAAPSAGNTRAPSGVRQQGTAVDRGAWEQPSALVAPSATINDVQISGTNNNNAVISGVTTGAPTEATVSIFPANIEYNSAVGQGPVQATLTTNALSVAFQDLRVGAYGISVEVSNDAYSATGVNAFGTFQIVGAGASTVVQEPMSGQILTIHGTTFGNPTSGTLYVPPHPTDPAGAVGQTADLVLSPGAFTVSKPMPQGNFAEGILIFTNAQGSSLPQPGTSPISVLGLGGNPEVPGDGPTTPDPVVESVTISPTTATGSRKFTAVATGSNNPPQSFIFTATAGTIDNDGNFVEPAKTSSVQTITITVKSTLNQAKTATAVVTLAAAEVVPGPEVTEVIVTPATATVGSGGTLQLSAEVLGTNNPGQGVTWTTPQGSVSVSGLFTAPVRSSNITFNVTATSVVNPDFSDSISITVLAAVVTPPEVTSVVVTPATATTDGNAVQLTAEVLGTNNPGQGVTWSTLLGTVSSSGRYVPPALTSSVRTTTVRATSTVDPDVYGEATITIEAEEIIIPEPGGDFVPSKARTLVVLAATGEFTGGAFWDLSNPTRPVGRKDPDTEICVTLDWTDVLDDLGETDIGELNLYPEGFTVTGAKVDGAKTTAVISGGVGPTSSITFHISTETLPTRSEERTVYFTIGDQ